MCLCVFLLPTDLYNLTSESFEPSLEDQLAVVGENQELQVSCLAPGGLPTPKLFWREPQGRIVSDTGPVRVQDDTLIVAKARRNADDGNYTCHAENMAGATHATVRIVVSCEYISIYVSMLFQVERRDLHGDTMLYIFSRGNVRARQIPAFRGSISFCSRGDERERAINLSWDTLTARALFSVGLNYFLKPY